MLTDKILYLTMSTSCFAWSQKKPPHPPIYNKTESPEVASNINSTQDRTWRRGTRLHAPCNLMKSLLVKTQPWYGNQVGFRERKVLSTTCCKPENARAPACLSGRTVHEKLAQDCSSRRHPPFWRHPSYSGQRQSRTNTPSPMLPSNYPPHLRDEDICAEKYSADLSKPSGIFRRWIFLLLLLLGIEVMRGREGS